MAAARLALTTVSIAAPVVGAVVATGQERPRKIGFASAAVSLAALIAAVWLTPAASAVLAVDALAAAPALAFAALVAASFLIAPSADLSGANCRDLLLCLAGALTLYCAHNPFLLIAGFAVSALPLLIPRAARGRRSPLKASIALGLATLLLAAGSILLMTATSGTAAMFALAAVLLASLIRSGVFPFHSWLFSACERPLPFVAVLSGQAGALVIARLALPHFPQTALSALPYITNLTIAGSLFTALVALGEVDPKRTLALLRASQNGFIVSGLTSGGLEGITGALVQWVVAAVALPGLILVLRCLEARYSDLSRQEFDGLAARTPRLAAFFLVFSLALVGLPGTLGFCSAELLFHGVLEAHPIFGLALPVAAAISAIVLLRLFSRIFWGRNRTHVPPMPDALLRERLALTAMTLFLIALGLLPHGLITSRVAPAEKLAALTQPLAHQ